MGYHTRKKGALSPKHYNDIGIYTMVKTTHFKDRNKAPQCVLLYKDDLAAILYTLQEYNETFSEKDKAIHVLKGITSRALTCKNVKRIIKYNDNGTIDNYLYQVQFYETDEYFDMATQDALTWLDKAMHEINKDLSWPDGLSPVDLLAKLTR